jgi:hypothetical protein
LKAGPTQDPALLLFALSNHIFFSATLPPTFGETAAYISTSFSVLADHSFVVIAKNTWLAVPALRNFVDK